MSGIHMWAITYLDGGDDEQNPGSRMYWSNEFGWASAKDATLFDHDDLLIHRLPQGGAWVPMDWTPPEPIDPVTYVVTVQFVFTSGIQDSNDFAVELEGVLKGVQFSELFEEYTTTCDAFSIEDVNR